MGICAADLSTPNHHSSIWTGFYVSFTFIFPYIISLATLCAIYIRGFGYNSYASKRASEIDVSLTNITSSSCMLACLLNLIYFVTILSSDEKSFSNPSVVFWVTYIISLKTMIFVLTMRFGSNTCTFDCTCCKEFLQKVFNLKSADSMSYELNDVDMTQSLTGKRKLSNVETWFMVIQNNRIVHVNLTCCYLNTFAELFISDTFIQFAPFTFRSIFAMIIFDFYFGVLLLKHK